MATLIGLGIDAVDVERFRTVLSRTPRVADRLFTESERESVATSADQVPRLAARFAAKEAVLKALGVGIGAIAWHDVEIVRQPSGAPTLRLRGSAAALASAAGVSDWRVSLTHTATVAGAVVAAL